MKEGLTTYLKMLFCIVLIAGWSFYFINTPNRGKQDKPTKQPSVQKKKKFKIITSKIKLKQAPIYASPQASTDKAKQSPQLKKTQTSALKVSTQDIKIKTKATESNPIDSKKIANATLEAITKEAKNETSADSIKLREEIKIDKQKLKPVIQKINELQNESLQSSWLPKIPEEPIQTSLADQIEVTSIVGKPSGENNIIIKNKLNNHIQSLDIGESYQELRLIKINGNEVYFKDTALNMIYKKNVLIN